MSIRTDLKTRDKHTLECFLDQESFETLIEKLEAFLDTACEILDDGPGSGESLALRDRLIGAVAERLIS